MVCFYNAYAQGTATNCQVQLHIYLAYVCIVWSLACDIYVDQGILQNI